MEKTKFKEFVENLSREDIGLMEKLDEMAEHEITRALATHIQTNKELFCKVETCVKMHVEMYGSSIKSFTADAWQHNLIKDITDYKAGLYRCNALYMHAILEALGILELNYRFPMNLKQSEI